jgi:hypothetical protein
MTVSRGPEIVPVRTTLEAAIRAPAMPHPDDRAEELERLKRTREKLEIERKKVENRIKTLEGPSR